MTALFDPRKPFFLAPADGGKLPSGARPDTPSAYGREFLSAILPAEGARSLLIYGGRYIVRIDGDRVLGVLDFQAFLQPPKVASTLDRELLAEDATFAAEKDGVLYVCNGGGTYAKDVLGKKGFLSAVDAKSGALLWRSDPLVCNSTFVIDGDVLVSGYGFTDEPDFVFVVRRADGVVEQRVPLDSGPSEITLSGRRVRVETYGHIVDLDLVP